MKSRSGTEGKGLGTRDLPGENEERACSEDSRRAAPSPPTERLCDARHVPTWPIIFNKFDQNRQNSRCLKRLSRIKFHSNIGRTSEWLITHDVAPRACRGMNEVCRH